MTTGSTALKSLSSEITISNAVLLGLAGVGLLHTLTVSASALKFLWTTSLRRGKKLSEYGQWAVVTGASAGIGRAYCDYLAKQGLNVLLISRTQSNLETAAAEIAEQFGVKTKVLAIDLAEVASMPLESEAWAGLQESVDAMDVGVLVNNAGKTQGGPNEFHLVDSAGADSTVMLNNIAMLKVTNLVLPGMVERGRGAIVNVSSVLSKYPAAPLASVYAATKGFVNTFTKAISEEYGPMGIDVQLQIPGPVSTSMLRGGRANTTMKPSPAVFMKHAGPRIGYETVCIPYPFHAAYMGLMSVLPASVATKTVKNSLQQLQAKLQAMKRDQRGG